LPFFDKTEQRLTPEGNFATKLYEKINRLPNEESIFQTYSKKDWPQGASIRQKRGLIKGHSSLYSHFLKGRRKTIKKRSLS